MLKQASVNQIRTGKLTREQGHIAVAMCFYPRGLRKELRDEYLKCLAPENKLFKEWLAFERQYGHEEAFRMSHYEKRFTLSLAAFTHLARLAGLSRDRDVFLVCQCAPGERCHREILLLEARARFQAEIGPVFHAYPLYFARQATP